MNEDFWSLFRKSWWPENGPTLQIKLKVFFVNMLEEELADGYVMTGYGKGSGLETCIA